MDKTNTASNRKLMQWRLLFLLPFTKGYLGNLKLIQLALLSVLSLPSRIMYDYFALETESLIYVEFRA